VLKWVIKTIFISSSPFAFLIINVKIISNFQKEWCTFGRKKGCLRKTKIIHFQSLSALNMQFISKKCYENLNYYASLVIFQTHRNVVLKSVHSLGWLFWLWVYPIVIVLDCFMPIDKMVTC
jgi:hypothetical protein